MFKQHKGKAKDGLVSDKDLLDLLKANKEYNNSELESVKKDDPEEVPIPLVIDEVAEVSPSLWQKIVNRLKNR